LHQRIYGAFNASDHFNQSPKLAIIAVTFPAVHELANDLEITDLVVTIAVDPVDRARRADR
jgi:hypothetical protein